MNPINEQAIREILSSVKDPNTVTDLVSSGAVKGIGIDENRVTIDIRLGYPADGRMPVAAAPEPQNGVAGNRHSKPLKQQAGINI